MANSTVNKVVLGSETLIDLTDTTATASDVVAGKSFHLASGVRTTGTATYAGSPTAGGNADKANAILFAQVDSTSTSTAYTATIAGVEEYYDGLTIMLKNGVVTSAAGFTIDVNGLGAKPVYTNLAAATAETTKFNVNYTMMFVYDSTRVSGGAWLCYNGYDSNSNTIGYQLRTNSGNRPMSDAAYRYRLYFTSADGSKWVPANTSTSTDATTARTLNTRAIDPFGPIVYNSTNGTTSSGGRPAVATLWQQYTLTIGYSYVKTLTAWDSVWLKCTPQSDGSAVMADIVQALPSSKDGYIYILLGMAYSTTAMELRVEHPVYWHDGTGIRLWTGAEGGSSTVEPATATPIVDGTAAVGTSAKYAREDHVHPTDTSRQATLVSGTNIKTIGSQSLLGSGNLTVANIGAAASSHAHGNITSGGDITATAPTIASGDKLIINDESESKITNGPAFGSSTTTFLRNDGTWAEPSSSGLSMNTTTCTLPTSGWTSDSITVTATGVTASNDVIVASAPASASAYAAAGIVCTAQGANTLTFSRTSANSAAITVNVMIFTS